MGDPQGLSENARAFLVEALLQRTEGTGPKSRANCGSGTESSDKITVGNASFLQDQHVDGTGTFSSNGLHPALEERLQHSPSSGAMPQPVVVGRNFLSQGTSASARLATESTKECPGLVNVRRSPPHWSGLGGSPDQLEQMAGSSNVQEADNSSTSSATHDLRTLSLQERLGVPLPCSSGDHWDANITQPGHDRRVPPLHPVVSDDHSNDSAPVLDAAVRGGHSSPTPSAVSMRRSLSPARVSEERAWDSGTASGEECCPEEPGDLSTPHDRLGGPGSLGCCPGRRGAAGASFETSGEMSEGTAAASPMRVSRLSPEAPGSSPEDVTTAGVANRKQLSPPEPPSSAERRPAPRLSTAMNIEPEEPKDPSLAELGITAELCSRDLWLEFHEHGTEMIITKMGRRMFPTVKVRLHGLRPSDSYIVYMDIVPVDDKRYRYIYHSSEWAVAGPGDSVGGPSRYIHPDSPASGRLWTSQGIVAFDKLKLTNRRVACSPAQISLHSMQKYRPRVHIQWTNDLVTPVEQQIDPRKSLTFSFRETEFITVTAYQNQEITRLKIASNPFAKGFRDVPASKRQRSPSSDSSGSGGGGGGGGGNQRTAKRARQVQVAPPSGGLWNYSYPIPVTHPPLICVDPFSQITLLQSYGIPLPTYQYEKR